MMKFNKTAGEVHILSIGEHADNNHLPISSCHVNCLIYVLKIYIQIFIKYEFITSSSAVRMLCLLFLFRTFHSVQNDICMVLHTEEITRLRLL